MDLINDFYEGYNEEDYLESLDYRIRDMQNCNLICLVYLYGNMFYDIKVRGEVVFKIYESVKNKIYDMFTQKHEDYLFDSFVFDIILSKCIINFYDWFNDAYETKRPSSINDYVWSDGQDRSPDGINKKMDDIVKKMVCRVSYDMKTVEILSIELKDFLEKYFFKYLKSQGSFR